jgi:hypothetical protein
MCIIIPIFRVVSKKLKQEQSEFSALFGAGILVDTVPMTDVQHKIVLKKSSGKKKIVLIFVKIIEN